MQRPSGKRSSGLDLSHSGTHGSLSLLVIYLVHEYTGKMGILGIWQNSHILQYIWLLFKYIHQFPTPPPQPSILSLALRLALASGIVTNVIQQRLGMLLCGGPCSLAPLPSPSEEVSPCCFCHFSLSERMNTCGRDSNPTRTVKSGPARH